MGKRISPEERVHAFEFLRQRYPNAFRLPGDIKPFEVGLGGELMRELKDVLPTVGIRVEAIYAVLKYYTCASEYKKARKVLGAPRINLQGEVVGEVTEEHLELGRQKNAETKAAKSKRKALQREMEARRIEKQKQLEAAAAKKAAKAAAQKAQEEAIEKKQKLLKEMSLRKPKKPPKQGAVQAKVVVKPTITVKSRKILSLKKNKE